METIPTVTMQLSLNYVSSSSRIIRASSSTPCIPIKDWERKSALALVPILGMSETKLERRIWAMKQYRSRVFRTISSSTSSQSNCWLCQEVTKSKTWTSSSNVKHLSVSWPSTRRLKRSQKSTKSRSKLVWSLWSRLTPTMQDISSLWCLSI